MRVRRVLAVAGIAVLCEAVSWRDLEPDGFAAALYVTTGIAFSWFALTARWREIPIFLAAFLAAAILEETTIYDAPPPEYCDPFCSGPLAVIFLVPVAVLLLVPLGMFAKLGWRDIRGQS